MGCQAPVFDDTQRAEDEVRRLTRKLAEAQAVADARGNALAVVADKVRQYKGNDVGWQRDWGWSVINGIAGALADHTGAGSVDQVGHGGGGDIAGLLSGEKGEAARHSLDGVAADLPGWRTSAPQAGESS